MIEIKNHCIELKESILKEINNKKNSKIDINILSSIYELFEDINIYVFKQYYKEYIDLKNITIREEDIIKNYAIEIEHEHYELLINNTEIKVSYPLVYLIINSQEKLEKLSKSSGIKIDNNLILVFRKNNNKWEIPIQGISYCDKEVNCIEVFKKRFVDFEIHSKTEDFEETIKYLQHDTFNKYKDFMKIINAKEIDFINIDNNYFYKTLNCFLNEKELDDKDNKVYKRLNTLKFKHYMNLISNFGVKI